MVSRDAALNDAQLAVLRWIDAGCPDGVFTGWAHRSSARMLAGRGLVRVRGHGATWSALIEPEGAYYLEHGHFRGASPTPRAPHRTRREPSRSIADAPTEAAVQDKTAQPDTDPAKAKPPKLGVSAQLIQALREVGQGGIIVDRNDLHTYRRRLARAERDRRIPSDHRVACEPVVVDGRHQTRFRLEPVPRWHVDALRIRTRKVRKHSTPAIDLDDSVSFQVSGTPRERALHLIDALVRGASKHGITVSVAHVEVDPGGYNRERRVRDDLAFHAEPDQVSLHFGQGIDKVSHEPTERELARARRGYLFPDFDDLPAEKLSIYLGDGRTAAFWSASWHDTDDHRLEEDLPRIIEEILFQLDHQVDAREAEERRRTEAERQLILRRQAWDEAKASATIAFRDAFLRDAMLQEARAFREATELRDYAAAITERAADLSHDEAAELLAWADSVREQAAKLDPTVDKKGRPTVPSPTIDDLAPFMGKHGRWRP
ncbi:hypothetical protein HWD35_21460 [Tsukamurella tyrosinosolvens]|uniref:hypothetical protein n=1 Tax=Tsukamurella tyrosinosolvens TaxID=57704 RepID=UPI001CE04CB3|nr:hypothetical protein [Tsukamurella tyrosinosolvens]MCA4997295.1 hypothetical protein [Tsukamurella tyrosinosolvens]